MEVVGGEGVGEGAEWGDAWTERLSGLFASQTVLYKESCRSASRNSRALFSDAPHGLTHPISFFKPRFASWSPPTPARMSLFEGRWDYWEGQQVKSVLSKWSMTVI